MNQLPKHLRNVPMAERLRYYLTEWPEVMAILDEFKKLNQTEGTITRLLVSIDGEPYAATLHGFKPSTLEMCLKWSTKNFNLMVNLINIPGMLPFETTTSIGREQIIEIFPPSPEIVTSN